MLIFKACCSGRFVSFGSDLDWAIQNLSGHGFLFMGEGVA
jgi:hypothetical protein